MARNRCNQVVRAAKRQHFQNNILNSFSAAVWKFFRFLGLGKCPSTFPLSFFSLDDSNFHFSSTYLLDASFKLSTIALISSRTKPSLESFSFSPVTEDEIRKTILSIKPKAVGWDAVSRQMIMTVIEYIIPFLTHIIHFSFDNSSFPALWRKAFVTPIPKVHSPLHLKNYRPISVLPFLSKVLEAAAHRQTSFLFSNKLLRSFQSGFNPDHSTTTSGHWRHTVRHGESVGHHTYSHWLFWRF